MEIKDFIKQVIEHPYWCVKEFNNDVKGSGIAKRYIRIHSVSDNYVIFTSMVFEMSQTLEGSYKGIKTTGTSLHINEFYEIYKSFEKCDDAFEKLQNEFRNTLINGLA